MRDGAGVGGHTGVGWTEAVLYIKLNLAPGETGMGALIYCTCCIVFMYELRALGWIVEQTYYTHITRATLHGGRSFLTGMGRGGLDGGRDACSRGSYD